MKILTNIRFVQTAGIAQILASLLDFVKNDDRNEVEIVGINVINKGKEGKEGYRINRKGKTTIITIEIKIPNIGDVLGRAKNLQDIEKRYASVINAYRKTIKEENPDLILINGTYYMPWCLFIAAKNKSIPLVLHYHGVLTKETEGWRSKQKRLFKKMEKSFDKRDLFYIFPSNITKKIVEKEVYGHKIKKYTILPNPVVSLCFFDAKKNKINKKNIGVVSRYAKIKNLNFCERLSSYNKNQGNKFIINLITDLSKNDKRYKTLVNKNIKIWPTRITDEWLIFTKTWELSSVLLILKRMETLPKKP